mmetsp:Transcript_55817/g.124669  ORF Transcript_55817/g.124669 Transcript_55817/m.124669 type:complete len:204 (+) Transcript_55817:402-1013(+)|eukprot:CAMPEP_0181222138 /NCGR_PEP_ID=MMETSP1096-20121128/29798_1 /TAXON_ID=156174 ORGANISM="Chrysochromulina ericina, Strain CCMP281" /NCGR_SAMPLE_ID=MMETSP1096 /ASSEMBLY_ACC=CAM_ASM_000453 /LENGTH=203 /DNA_ID=CAMNT_0023314863 /DNA_START=335 /DNA_END=946 /DNA_ORIENTATION=+
MGAERLRTRSAAAARAYLCAFACASRPPSGEMVACAVAGASTVGCEWWLWRAHTARSEQDSLPRRGGLARCAEPQTIRLGVSSSTAPTREAVAGLAGVRQTPPSAVSTGGVLSACALSLAAWEALAFCDLSWPHMSESPMTLNQSPTLRKRSNRRAESLASSSTRDGAADGARLVCLLAAPLAAKRARAIAGWEGSTRARGAM